MRIAGLIELYLLPSERGLTRALGLVQGDNNNISARDDFFCGLLQALNKGKVCSLVEIVHSKFGSTLPTALYGASGNALAHQQCHSLFQCLLKRKHRCRSACLELETCVAAESDYVDSHSPIISRLSEKYELAPWVFYMSLL